MLRWRCFALLAALAAGQLASLPVAHASSPDQAQADECVRRGAELVESGRWAEARERYECAMNLDPRPMTMASIAFCLANDGKLLRADAKYAQAEALNRESPKPDAWFRKHIETKRRELRARIPTLKITAPHAASGLAVKLDGERVLPDAIGAEIPVDPGMHEVIASAAGYSEWKQRPILKERDRTVIKALPPPAPVVADELAPPARPGSTPAVPVAAGPAAGVAHLAVQPSSGVPIWSWAVGGGGLALLGVAAGFGVDGFAAVSALKANCGESYGTLPCQLKKGPYDWAGDNARKDRDLGLFIGAGGAGLVAISTAIYGIATARSAKTPPAGLVQVGPLFVPGAGGALIRGTFY